MGYWVYHEKATLDRNSEFGAYEISDEYDSDLDFNFFEKYIQKVNVKVKVNSIVIIKDLEFFEEEKNRLNNSFIFHESDQKSIKECIRKNKYDLLIKEVRSGFPGRILYDFYKKETKQGIYVDNVFKSPFKACRAEFYEKYQTGTTYTDLNVFKEACELEYETWKYENKEEFKNHVNKFKENLIEKYEYGKSMLYYV